MKTKKILLITVLSAVLFLGISLLVSNIHTTIHNLVYFFVYSLIFSLGNMWYFNTINKLLNWDKNPEKTLIISILGAIPVNALIYFGISLIIKVLIFGQSFQEFIRHINPLEYTIVILFALVIALFIIVNYSFKNIREAQLKTEQLKTQNEQIRFESLKSQLDPHFLFNNLNVLASLIDENPAKAEEFTLKLSDIYQYVLSRKDKKLVPLKDEIDFAKKYLELLKMRFENGLLYILPDAVPEGKIPPLSLQLLLENAVKHNKISDQKPLKINISIQNNRLVITNNLNPKQKKDESFQIGLNSLTERYKLLNLQVEIIQNPDSFTVKLPIIK